MRDKFFEFRPAATDPGELPTEDRHRLGDPHSCALESLAQPAHSRHAAARRPWSMHTQEERCSPVEPDVQVEIAADVLPRPGRRDLIEQRGDRGVIGAGPWPEPAGQGWRRCQSLGPSSRSFAGSIPSAGRNSMPGEDDAADSKAGLTYAKRLSYGMAFRLRGTSMRRIGLVSIIGVTV